MLFNADPPSLPVPCSALSEPSLPEESADFYNTGLRAIATSEGLSTSDQARLFAQTSFAGSDALLSKLQKMLNLLKAKGARHADGSLLTFNPGNNENTSLDPGGVNYCDRFGVRRVYSPPSRSSTSTGL